MKSYYSYSFYKIVHEVCKYGLLVRALFKKDLHKKEDVFIERFLSVTICYDFVITIIKRFLPEGRARTKAGG